MTVYRQVYPDLTNFGSSMAAGTPQLVERTEEQYEQGCWNHVSSYPPDLEVDRNDLKGQWCSRFSFWGALATRLASLLGISTNIYTAYMHKSACEGCGHASCLRTTRSRLIIFQELTRMKLLPV